MIDVGAARNLVAAAPKDMPLPVTPRWIERALQEIEAGRAAIRQLAALGGSAGSHAS